MGLFNKMLRKRKQKEEVDLFLDWCNAGGCKIADLKDEELYQLELKVRHSESIDEEIELRKKVIEYYAEYKDDFFARGGYYKEHFINMHMKCHNSQNPCFEAIEPHVERLKYIEENYDRLIVEEKQQKEDDIKRQNLVKNLDNELKEAIMKTPNILQSDLYKMFDPLLKEVISEKLYYWAKSNIVLREKHGRSYKLKLND